MDQSHQSREDIEPPTAGEGLVPVVGLGASAGGLQALRSLLSGLSESTPAAFVVVQHLSPDHDSMMVELLARSTALRIESATDGAVVQPGHVYVMTPKTQVLVKDNQLEVRPLTRVSGTLTFPIDTFFDRLAAERGAQSVAVVLSGTGSDGSRGVRSVHEAGGLVLVQSPEDAEFDGMLRAAIDSGAADRVGRASELAELILRHLTSTPEQRADIEAGDLITDPVDRAIAHLTAAGETDYSIYKPSTLFRRLRRRAMITGATSTEAYLELLASDEEEQAALREDLLISVTRFNRDPSVWKALEDSVLPGVIEGKEEGDSLRIWVTACASGEEAYTIAMLAIEALEAAGSRMSVKVFATDVGQVVEFGSLGVYPQGIVEDLGPDRVRRFFDAYGNGYRVKPELRSCVVFARHDLCRHAPFTRMDIVTCRNLLIYVRPPYQDEILRSLHFALRPNGYLVLGQAEALGSLTSEFVTVDRANRIYRKFRDVRLVRGLMRTAPTPPGRDRLRSFKDPREAPQLAGEVLGAWVRSRQTSGLVISPGGELLATYGDPASLFRFPDGRVQAHFASFLKTGLEVPVSAAVRRARDQDRLVRFLHVAEDADGRRLDIAAVPLHGEATPAGTVAVFLTPSDEGAAISDGTSSLDLDEAAARRIAELEHELARSLQDNQVTVEELETANEEQQATNEEVLAANEELQSTNEELQSVNEELQTVNTEFRAKLVEVNELNADLDNLLRSTGVAVVFVDPSNRIRKFTPAAAEMINLVPSDVNRRLTDITHRLVGLDLGNLLAQDPPLSRTVHTEDGRTLDVRLLSYVNSSGGAEGRVLTLYDITEADRARTAVLRSRTILRRALDLLPQEISIVDHDGRMLVVNRALASHWDRTVEEMEDNLLPGLDEGEPASVKLLRDVRGVLERGRPLYVSAEETLSADGRPRVVQTTRLPLGEDATSKPSVLSVVQDITEVRAAEETVRRQSMYDPLTRLPNRLLFSERVDHAVQRLARRSQRPAAVLFLDLDSFKEVNDTEGHLAGDRLLVEISARLTAAIRPGDSVARFGGDEFALLLEDVGGEDEVLMVTERLHERMREPIDLGASQHFVSVSVGVALVSDPTLSVTDVLRAADVAMYAAKRSGPGRTCVFTAELEEANQNQVRTRQQVRAAVARQEFLPWYQPIVDTEIHGIVGVEALLRWPREEQVVGPGAFLDDALDAGILPELESSIWPTVAHDIHTWRDALGVLPPGFFVSVNLSAESLADPSFGERFLGAFRDVGVDPGLITAELTEHSLLSQTRLVAEHLSVLRSAGVRLYLDDFGTGHSSLTNLIRFQLDGLKVDRMFVHPRGAARKLAQAAVGIARDLELGVVAEGVETTEARDFVASLGVTRMQGYLFARPMPGPQVLEQLTRAPTEAATGASVKKAR